ncbi:MAG: DoxX family protein [Chloroflexi bacterium]|nr:DoxX family protein [Chloroflexota bacterium]MBU1748666.1 DoxX family protein [Chloroflexota bacterium]MBU1878325.1 DoxX family protein [Chloroflexota bacterium]
MNIANILLWALQIILALKFVSVAYTHGLRPDPAKMQRGRQRLGPVARPLLIAAALGALFGAVGLILPAATGILAWLTPWSAALLALMMLVALGFHIVCREGRLSIVVGLILFALAASVAVGRWVIAPF